MHLCNEVTNEINLVFEKSYDSSMYSSRIIRYKDSKFPYLLNGIMNGLTIDLDFFSVSAYVLLGILSRVGGTSE